MKKMFSTICLLINIGILSGCGTTPQEEFMKEFQYQQELNSGTIKLVIDEVNLLGDSKNQTEMDTFAKQFNGSFIEGDFLIDKKSKNLFFDMKAKVLQEEMPFTFYSNNKEGVGYVSASSFDSIVSVAQKLTNTISTMQVDAEIMDGKYLKLTPENVKEVFDIEVSLKNKSPKQLSSYLETKDKKSFKKKGNELTHHVSNKEWRNFLKDLKKEKDHDIQQWASNKLEEVDRATFDLTIDSKKHTREIICHLTTTEKNVTSKFRATIQQDFKASNKSVKIPNERDTIHLDDFINDAQSDPQVNDENMKILIESVLADKENIDEAAAESGKRFYRQYLNDEQYQQLVKVLDEIVAENSK